MIFFVIGPPRSGTTYTAKVVAESLNIPLLPEAQWIIDVYKGKRMNQYSQENWLTYNEIKNHTSLNTKKIKNLFMNEFKARGISCHVNNIIEHTPQNCLIMNKLITLDDSKFISPLRDPKKSIYSLYTQNWFSGSLPSAALYNFRSMLMLLKYRKKINFIELEENVSMQIKNMIDQKKYKDAGYINFIENDEKLLSSHKYFKTNKFSNSYKSSTFLEILSFPSRLIYLFLKK